MPLGDAVKGSGQCNPGSGVIVVGVGSGLTCQSGNAGSVIACQAGGTGNYYVYGCFGGTTPNPY